MVSTELESRSSRDLRRRGIVDVAFKVFLEEGYGAASMSTIAAAVGGSKATLYTYFKSKSELFSAVLESRSEAFTSEDLLREASLTDICSTLTQMADRLLSFITAPECVAIHRLVIAECGRFPELGQAFFETGPRAKIEAMANFFADAMAAGRLREGDPYRAAQQFFSLCKAGQHLYLMWNVAPPPTRAQIDAEVASAVDVFMRAYAPTAQASGV